MEEKKTNTQAVLGKFDELTETYTRIFNICYDALAPGKTQQDRNKVRDMLKANTDGKGKV